MILYPSGTAFACPESRTANGDIYQHGEPGLTKLEYATIHIAATLAVGDDNELWSPAILAARAHALAHALFEPS